MKIELEPINAAIKNGNAVVNNLANEGKFVESGVVNSLTQVIRVLWVEYQRLLAEAEKAAAPVAPLRAPPGCGNTDADGTPCVRTAKHPGVECVFHRNFDEPKGA